MNLNFQEILTSAFYLLMIINPISKICILSVFSSEEHRKELKGVVTRSSAIAALILLLVALTGDFILHKIFHVEIYSLRVAGGIVLFVVGYKALTKGVFFEVDQTNRFADFSIVPLACPMIAGPATIAATAAMAAAKPDTQLPLTIAILLAVLVNLTMMLLAPVIGGLLRRFNIMGALIRITGLIVATIAVQMIFTGIDGWQCK